MVTVGETVFELRPVTVPTAWLMDRLVALAVVQDKVADCPLVIVEGLAVKEEMTGAGGGGGGGGEVVPTYTVIVLLYCWPLQV